MSKESIEIPLVKATYEELQQVICELQVERYKYKSVLDKIKEYLWDNTNFETVYHYDKDITVGIIRAELEEILEELK